MNHKNIEIKAKSKQLNEVREILKSKNAKFIGLDHQVDTYFNARTGRLKLRVGNIENSLIHYQRSDKNGPKQSNVTLYKSRSPATIKDILEKSLGTLVVVDKKREIYFIDNVKFHLDEVKDLGTFVEIEAIDEDGTIGTEKLTKQCNYYINLLKIDKKDLISRSYSDLLLNKSN